MIQGNGLTSAAETYKEEKNFHIAAKPPQQGADAGEEGPKRTDGWFRNQNKRRPHKAWMQSADRLGDDMGGGDGLIRG